MSIEAKHAYRFGFLKSEKWQNIRLEILAKREAKCTLCGKHDLFNDVHHTTYPERWQDTKDKHVIVLCRSCHNAVHAFMRWHPAYDPRKATRCVQVDRWNFRDAVRKVKNQLTATAT